MLPALSNRPALFGCKPYPRDDGGWDVWFWVSFPDGTSRASADATRPDARRRAVRWAEDRGYQLEDEDV